MIELQLYIDEKSPTEYCVTIDVLSYVFDISEDQLWTYLNNPYENTFGVSVSVLQALVTEEVSEEVLLVYLAFMIKLCMISYHLSFSCFVYID